MLLAAKQAVDIKLKATEINRKSAEFHCSEFVNKLTACVDIISIEQKPNRKPINFIILILLIYSIFYDV